MKICMFTNTYLPHVGGVARSVSFFAEDLCKAGHRVLVIAPTYPGNETHGHCDPDILRLPAIQKFNGSDFSLRIPVPFLVDEKLDDFDPDIIHSHHPYLLGDAALRVARRRQLPLIFTHHTLYEEYTHYIVDNPESMKRFAAFLSTNYAGMCNRVIAPSQSIKDLISERGVTAPISIVPTGVDTAFFANGDGVAFRKSHGISTGTMVIGHLGRLAPEKNLDYLARAVAHAMERLPEAYFLVVGEGPSQKEIARYLRPGRPTRPPGSGRRDHRTHTGRCLPRHESFRIRQPVRNPGDGTHGGHGGRRSGNGVGCVGRAGSGG